MSPTPIGGEPIAPAHLVRSVLGLAAVVLIIFIAGWALRRMGQSRWHGSGDLRVVAGLAVGPRERVVLMQVGAQQVLLGVTPGSVRMLLILDEPLGQQQGPGSRHAAREAREPVIEGFRRSLVAALHASRHDEEPGGRP